jgi:hypothetical protein
MLDLPNVSATLATASGATASPIDVVDGAISRLDILNHPDELLDALASLHVVWASIFVVVGVLCVMNGYRWHKKVVIVCALLAGIGLGNLLSHSMGDSRIVMGALGLLCAVIATPLLKYAVAVFGGLTGAFIGANLWSALGGAPETHLAGAGMGFIAFAMASFILFRPVVVTFTSIGGGALAVLGGITLLMHVPGWESAIRESLSTNQLLIPLLVGVAAVTGFVMQQNQGGGAKSDAGDSKAKPAHA